ncbi:hypothetical protein ACHAP5_012294 [Fusarium lateritium]
MESVVLPDGSLSSIGYGFKCRMDIFFLSFYGDVAIDLQDGLEAEIEMAPLSLGSLFKLEGNGKGVIVKEDTTGNPINNNQLAITAAQQKVIRDATTQQLVAASGPVLKIQTSASPYLHLKASVSLFEIWAGKVAQDVITAVDSVASVLHNVWDKSASEVASIMKNAGFNAQDIASGLKDFFNLGPDEVHGLLRQIGFSNGEIGTVFQVFGGPLFGPFARTLFGGGHHHQSVTTDVLGDILGDLP